MKINDVMYLCAKKNIFMYFLSYYKPCTIDSAKNHALLKNLSKIKKNKKTDCVLSVMTISHPLY